jgi:phosphohistidine phosphatase
MQLYILRHGIAEDGKPGGNDSDRALTSEGKKKLRDILQVAQKAGVSPTLIISSPYRRAVESAQVAVDELGYKGKVLETNTLLPTSDPKPVWDEIRVHKSESELMLVGHEPLLSTLIGYLLAAPSLSIDLKKGALVRIDFDGFGAQPHGILKWMLVPKLVV